MLATFSLFPLLKGLETLTSFSLPHPPLQPGEDNESDELCTCSYVRILVGMVSGLASVSSTKKHHYLIPSSDTLKFPLLF